MSVIEPPVATLFASRVPGFVIAMSAGAPDSRPTKPQATLIHSRSCFTSQPAAPAFTALAGDAPAHSCAEGGAEGPAGAGAGADSGPGAGGVAGAADSSSFSLSFLQAETATVVCRGSLRYRPRVGNHDTRIVEGTWRFTVLQRASDWIVDAVEVTPTDVLADRTLQARGGVQTLRLSLRRPVTEGRPLDVTVRAHRQRPPNEQELPSDVFQLVHWKDLRSSRRLMACQVLDAATHAEIGEILAAVGA